jgi:3-oxoacyl-[acyl-carrier-protein] synthase-3
MHALVSRAEVMSSHHRLHRPHDVRAVRRPARAPAVRRGMRKTTAIGIIDSRTPVDGSGGDALCMPAAASLRPRRRGSGDSACNYVKQDGATVFKFAVRNTEEAARRSSSANGVKPCEIDLFVSHQANRRIIMSATEKLGIPPEKVVINIERFGNTTAGPIPLALNDAVEQKASEEGDSASARLGRRRFTVGTVLHALGAEL